METWIPNTTSSSDKKELTLCKELMNELIPLVDSLVKAVKYYRSPFITKDQYRELQELNKFFDTHEILDNSSSSCCSGEKEHMH